MSRLLTCECCQRPFFDPLAEKVMLLLIQDEPQTGAELAKALHVSQPAITKAIRRIETQPADYIDILPNPHSKNVKMIYLSEGFRLSIKKQAPEIPA